MQTKLRKLANWSTPSGSVVSIMLTDDGLIMGGRGDERREREDWFLGLIGVVRRLQ